MNARKNFKAIFFDNDGLLVNTEPLYVQATQEVLAEVGIEMTTEWYISENLGKGRSSFSALEETGAPEHEIAILRTKRNDRYNELLKAGVPVIDGVSEALERLRGNFLMGVVTSSRKHHFETIMQQTGLARFFSFFITGDDVENHKPHPEPYLAALARAGCRASECLVLEDAPRGVKAAKAAGLTCFAIPDALTRGQDLSMADRILAGMHEVPPILGV